MLIKWIKRILWAYFAYMIWRKIGIGASMLFLVLTIILDFIALVIAGKLAIKGFKDGNTPQDIIDAQDRFFEYQRNPLSASRPLVTFAQLFFGPLCSLTIPLIFGGWFLSWYP